MDKTGREFEYVRNKFRNVSEAKVKEGIFIGLQIRELMQDKQFDEDLKEAVRNAWLSFKMICKDLFIHSLVFSPGGRSGRNQNPVMEPMWLLTHCILGKFLGVVCHCFSPPLDVPTFAATCLCVLSDARDPSSERWNCGWERCPVVILPKFRLPLKFRDLLHAANLWHGTDGFTSPPKEGVLKIRRLRPGLNLRTWVPKAKGLIRKSQSSELSGCCAAGPIDFVKRYGMQYESENPLSEVTLEFFSRKSRRSQWLTRWKISKRHYDYGKAVPRQVGLKYVGRLLLDTDDGCTWRQIPAKFISLYILEECFCLFHEQVKYCFIHFNSSVSLKTCLIEKFCIHIWIQHKKYC